MKYVLLISTMITCLSYAAGPMLIYTEKGARYYTPSGYMGDISDLKLNQYWKRNPAHGKYCIQLRYSGEKKEGQGWAGIYWQHPPNNWGTMKGGYDLSQFKKCTFYARGEIGGEYISEFKVGGIDSLSGGGDSGMAYIERIELTKEWKRYEIDLTEMEDRTKIIGGFCVIFEEQYNLGGATIYLDQIVIE